MKKLTFSKQFLFYAMLLIFLICVSMQTLDYDFDLWARLIAGMGFIQTGHVLKVDFLSYTPTHIWFDHEWGSGVIFYLVQHYFSYIGLFVLQVLLLFSTFFTVSRVINLRSCKTTNAFNILFYLCIYYVIGAITINVIRCQMFSFLLFSVFIYILELSRKKNLSKPLILLPFLMIIWNNLHGGCVSGIGIIGIYFVGELLNGKPFKKYLFTLIATILVLPINPWGLSYLKFLVSASTMPRPNVIEWWSIFKFKNSFPEFKIFAVIMILTEFLTVGKNFSYRKADKTKFLALIFTLFIAVEHIKLIPFFAITAMCFIYDDFYTIYNGVMAYIKEKLHFSEEMFSESFQNKKIIGIYLAIVFSFLIYTHVNKIRPFLSTRTYAVREVEFLKINHIKGNLLINFGQGSFAAYKLYPDVKIFMDGRYEEVYPLEYMQIMQHFFTGMDDWKYILQKFPTNILIIEKFYPVYTKLLKDNDWKLVFSGHSFGVFVKSDMAKSKYIMPSDKIKFYRKHVFDTDIKFKKSS